MKGHFAPNIVGHKFGRLTVQSRAQNAGRKSMWFCRCDCGAIGTFQAVQMRSGKTRSCGCLQREEASAKRLKHGATIRNSRWPEWGVWRAMINRCHRPATLSFERYGARGISVCARWRFGEANKTGFECFIADMGRRPSDDLSIDRRDNDGNYEPGNCHWATMQEQATNRRSTKGTKRKAV